MKCGTIQLDAALLFLILANYISHVQHQAIRKQKSEQKQQKLALDREEQRPFVVRQDDEPFTSMEHRLAQNIGGNPRRSPSSSVVANSSWIGNIWIPPHGYRFYTPREFRAYFWQHSILFVGDSTARRTYASFYAILNATDDNGDVSFWDLEDPAVIDVNKKAQTEVCDKPGLALCRHHQFLDRSEPTAEPKRFDLMGGRCPSDIESLAKSSFQGRLKDYSLIIISMGAAELNDMCEIASYSKKKKKKPLRDYIAAIRELLLLTQQGERQVGHTTIVWRTMGNIGWSEDSQGIISLHKAQYRNIRIVNRIQQHEEEVQQQHQLVGNASANDAIEGTPQRRQGIGGTRVTVLDWGKVIEPRSYPFRDRIAGDIPPHYGLEARLVFLQMLMNHLIQQEVAV